MKQSSRTGETLATSAKMHEDAARNYGQQYRDASRWGLCEEAFEARKHAQSHRIMALLLNARAAAMFELGDDEPGYL